MHSKHLRISVVVAVWAICTACNGCFGCKAPPDRPGSTLSKSCDEEQPIVKPQQLDILFVIDNSSSMREEQEGVARELTTFVSKLRMAGGVQQDIRVGAITTTVYENFAEGGAPPFLKICSNGTGFYCPQSGKLQPVPDRLPDGGFVPGTGSQRKIDADDPELVDKFARLVQQGVDFNSGQETPFEALRIALVDEMARPLEQGGNGGFLRDGARLLIVVLTDEDDCSEKVRPPTVTVGRQPEVDYCGDKGMQLTSVAEYFDILNGLKNPDGSKRDVVYTTIGPVSTVNKAAMKVLTPVVTDAGTYQQVRNIDCPTSIQPGFRHRAMTELFDPKLENLASICQASYAQTLIDIASLAGIQQTLEIEGVPDPGVLQLIIRRADDTLQSCTIDNGGFTWQAPTEAAPVGRATFTPSCLRRLDDLELKIERLCIF
ncbi:MAG: VWA domain-containing protein [Myxococcaceae bacterium]|nr:VWA domain-containing protein [Myxococcaceae bacterium]